MIIKSAGLPGLILKAWVVFEFDTNVILRKSDSVTSVTALAGGQKTINFQAGTLSGGPNLIFAPSNRYSTEIYIQSSTTASAVVQSLSSGGNTAPQAGQICAWYFYEL
jgi:hypothetical protein